MLAQREQATENIAFDRYRKGYRKKTGLQRYDSLQTDTGKTKKACKNAGLETIWNVAEC
jgi:hypothetical protein